MTIEQAFGRGATSDFLKATVSSDFEKAESLKSRADINAVGNDGISPLIWAMSASNFDEAVTEYLLANGASPNYRDAKRGVSAMYLMAGGNRPAILKLLLRYQGDPNLLGPGVDGDVPILFTAAANGQNESVILLIDAGADVNWLDSEGISAAVLALTTGRFDIIDYLLDHGLKVGLPGLLKACQRVAIPEDSDMVPWKAKVVDRLSRMLEKSRVQKHKLDSWLVS